MQDYMYTTMCRTIYEKYLRHIMGISCNGIILSVANRINRGLLILMAYHIALRLVLGCPRKSSIVRIHSSRTDIASGLLNLFGFRAILEHVCDL